MLFVLLFIPATSMGNTPAETCNQYRDNESSCNQTAGCFYDSLYPTSDKCRRCERGSYCPATETEPQPCTSPFTDSDLGATSPEECFEPDLITCRQADDTVDNQCRHYNTDMPNRKYLCGTNHDKPAHMESNNVCYYNMRYCGKFGQTGCSNGTFNDDNSDTPLAHWYPMDQKWGVSGCKCLQGNFIDTNEKHCNGEHFNITPPTNTTVPYATSNIPYTEYTNTPGNISSYYCTSCENGYYVTNLYSPSNPPTDFTYCSASTYNSAGIVVCNCEQIPQGWYGTANCNWNANTITTNQCSKEPCPAGKTTNYRGATSADDCEYTNQTKFCDSKGCFQLNQTELLEWGLINP